MSSPLTIINPNDRNWTRHRYVLWFGACGPTHLMAYANSLDDALEECGEWLAKHAPGLIMAAWGEEHSALVKEACEEAGLTYPPPSDVCADMDHHYQDAQQSAESDLTYTESGYLTSHEWGITLEDPTRSEIKAFIAELAERHYSDEPVVKVA